MKKDANRMLARRKMMLAAIELVGDGKNIEDLKEGMSQVLDMASDMIVSIVMASKPCYRQEFLKELMINLAKHLRKQIDILEKSEFN
jgi:hypothetical protein